MPTALFHLFPSACQGMINKVEAPLDCFSQVSSWLFVAFNEDSPRRWIFTRQSLTLEFERSLLSPGCLVNQRPLRSPDHAITSSKGSDSTKTYLIGPKHPHIMFLRSVVGSVCCEGDMPESMQCPAMRLELDVAFRKVRHYLP